MIHPIKAAGSLLMALGGEPIRTAWRAFKDLITFHPIKALEEPFKGVGREFQDIGTVLTLGAFDNGPKRF